MSIVFVVFVVVSFVLCCEEKAPLHQHSIVKDGHIYPNPDQKCPICFKKIEFTSGRYPNYLCDDCINRLTDERGVNVYFFNTEWGGTGCQGYYDKEGIEKYDSDLCYIKEQEKLIQCRAEEAYMGGIVVQPTYEK